MPLKFDYGYLFEKLWKSYPIHVGKMAAYKAFEKLKLNAEEVDELVMHIEKRKRDDVKWLGEKGVRYIPHLATFLNQHRWEDEYMRVRRVSGPSTPGVMTATDEDNKRAWVRDMQKRGLPVPPQFQHYMEVH